MLGSAQIPAIVLDGNQVQEMIAPVQDTLIADRNYTVGQQFILNGTLYKVTTAITSGSPIIVSGSSANCELADTITEQINENASDIKNLANEYIATVQITTTENGVLVFPSNRVVISAMVSINSYYCPLQVCPTVSTQDRAYTYLDRSVNPPTIKNLTANTSYNTTYRYIKR